MFFGMKGVQHGINNDDDDDRSDCVHRRRNMVSLRGLQREHRLGTCMSIGTNGVSAIVPGPAVAFSRPQWMRKFRDY